MNSSRRRFRILAIDGGGIRGAIPAAFLAELESRLGRPLHEAFDYVAGTSAGGLLALYIGGKGGTARDALELFGAEKAGRIMDKSLFDRMVPDAFHLGPKYDGKGKRAVLQEVFGPARLQFALTPTLVTAYDPADRRFVAFKSHGGGDSEGNPLMSEIADATTAAPVFFPPAVIGTAPARHLVDGGLGANNPAMAAIAEALKMGVKAQDIEVVSLGTGRPAIRAEDREAIERDSANWGGIDWLRHGIVDHLMDASGSAIDYWCTQILGDRYTRIQYDLDGPSHAMDDVSASNIESLKRAGRDWFRRDGARVLERLEPLPIPMAPRQSIPAFEMTSP